MILEIHPKSRKITIEIPEEFVDRDLNIEVKPKDDIDELFGYFSHIQPKYELEKKAWEMAVLEKYAQKLKND